MSQQPSRIAAARRQADVAKQLLAVTAVSVFGAVFLLVRSERAASANSTAVQPASFEEAQSDDGWFGGGSVAQAPSSQSLPQAQTGMS